ncbi:MAG: PEGA domain-containing protein [Woeseiaceae bacterium]|nr:PEGA domain-containing protein [Woeseiaceae bacterium]
MIVDAIVVHGNEGDLRLALDDLPVRLGTSGDCGIRLPGPAGAVGASLDALDGQPFLQPAGSAPVTVNGAALKSSRRLAAGDEIGFYGSRIEVAEEAGALSLTVRLEDSAYITRPPEAADDAAGAAEETIAPTAFQRAREIAPETVRDPLFKWQHAVAAALAVLAVLSWLLFTSRSIQFDVQPAGADSVQVRGGWFRLPLADRILLREGTYTVEVEKAGYYDVAQTFEVDESPSRTVTIEMRRLPGYLTVVTDEDIDALVTIDDTNLGEAPFGPVELEPGTHSIRVTADRYLPFEDVLPMAGLGREEVVDVQLVPRWANVTIRSEPADAVVYRGESQVGRTPVTLELMEGRHELSVVREGFKAWDGVIDASPNDDRTLPTIELEPANAVLTVNSVPRGANVTVDGRYRGQSPIRLALSPGVDYRIGLSKAGYGSTERRVRLEAAASRSITVDLSARTGEVTVQVSPADAEVYLDGRLRSSGTASFDLPSSPHRLEVRKPGYETYARTVTPRPGYPQTIQVSLLSEEQARLRSVAASMTTSQGQVLRRVEPGSFTMGASRREQGRRANEVIVPVEITKPFFISAKEVTNAEYLRFKSLHDSGAEVHASLAGNNNPVVNVTWAEAVEYLNWLSAEEGLTPAYVKRFEKWEPVTPTPNGYRLPTEAEWAWAVRYDGNPGASRFPWGDRLPPPEGAGNFADQSAQDLVPTIIPGYNDGYASTAPVGTFKASPLGLFDGAGNVAEWVQDYYSVPQPGQTTPVQDPTGPRRGSQHVIRGSSWRHAGVTELRSSYRDFGSAGRVDVGFRIAKNVL